MEMLFRIDRHLAKIERAVVVVLFSGMIGLVCFNIVARNLFNASFQTVFEIAPAMVLWLALIGSTLALRHRRHIRIELVRRYLPPPSKRWAAAASGLFGMGVMGLLMAASFAFVRNEIDLFGPWGWVSIIFPVFFGLSLMRYTLSVMEALWQRAED